MRRGRTRFHHIGGAGECGLVDPGTGSLGVRIAGADVRDVGGAVEADGSRTGVLAGLLDALSRRTESRFQAEWNYTSRVLMDCGLAGEALRGVTLTEAEIALWDMDRLKEKLFAKLGEDALEQIQFNDFFWKY